MNGNESDSRLAGAPSVQYTPQLFQVQGEESSAQDCAGMSMLLQLALNFGCTVLSTATWGCETRLFLEGRALASAAAKLTYSLQPTLLPALISHETVTLTPGSSALQLEDNVIGRARDDVCSGKGCTLAGARTASGER